jgi:A/G-specific adenine glycosylase
MRQNEIAGFRCWVYRYYDTWGRHDLPWRQTQDPYAILVSEVMLQQTQVGRVISKYIDWMKTFPSASVLARASDQSLLTMWSGFGYNRRCLYLKKTAQIIVQQYSGTVPRRIEDLVSLPGIGRYTASAIRVFSYNTTDVLIETNIRSVFLYHFFWGMPAIDDHYILNLIKLTVDMKNPRKWYSALMDYGAHIKHTFTNPNRNSEHYNKQSVFEGSNRQLRGEIIKQLLESNGQSVKRLAKRIGREEGHIQTQLLQLKKEGVLNDSPRVPNIWLIKDSGD